MVNGNLLHVCTDYKKYKVDDGHHACTVYLEFAPDTMRVVKATAEGDGCYRAY
jgi:hypothetical protein